MGDQQGEGALQYNELAFLDDWEAQVDTGDLLEAAASAVEVLDGGQHIASRKRSVTPGPGAYNIKSGFAAKASLPSSRHGGTFSMGQKLYDVWTMPTIGPDQYESGPQMMDTMKHKKPVWSFSTSPSTRCPTGLTVVPRAALMRPYSSMGAR